MAKHKEEKTNVMRTLEQKKIAYTAHAYDPEGPIDGVSVAQTLGQPAEQVFKTLVARGDKTGYLVFCIPVAEELELRAAALATGNKKVELIHVKELLPLTGYLRGGCSPIGMKKKFPTYVDETAQLFDEIAVSAGLRGAQIILAPDALLSQTEGAYAALTA